MMVGVLLAGGASTRMKSHKALAKQGRTSYLALGIRHLWLTCSHVIAVLGANGRVIQRSVEDEFTRLAESGELHEELSRTHRQSRDGYEVHFARNPRWRAGMLSSAQVGLREALDLRPKGVIVLPVDHPSVRPDTIASIAGVLDLALAACRTSAERGRFAYAVVPRYRGRRGHPLALSAALTRAIAMDRQARDLSDAVRRSARLVGYLDTEDAGILRNVNQPGD